MAYPEVPLASVCSNVRYGFTASATDQPIGPRFLRITDIVPDLIDWSNVPYAEVPTKQLDKYLLNDGDIVVARTGATVGFAKLLKHPEHVVFASYLVRFRPNDEVCPYYVGAVVESSVFKEYVRQNAGGAAQPNANAQVLGAFPLPLPPLPIQRRIAGILSAYDDLIEVNTRRIKALEEMARRTYEEWFVHYRFPGGDGARPSDWKQVKLKDRIELAYGKALKAADRAGGEIPVYGSSGIVGWHNEALVDEPTLIVGRKGNVGSIHWSKTSFYAIDTVFYVKTDLPLEFVFQNLHRQRFQNSDAAVPGLNRNQAYSLPLIVPASDLLTLYVDYARPIHNFASQLHQQNTNLCAQRDLLLPRLVSGAIDVSDAEAALPEPAEVAAE